MDDNHWEKDKYYYCVYETVESRHYVEGDQRSRDAPGHGYPAGYETVIKSTFYKFNNEEELKKWIQRNENKNFIILEARKLSFKKDIQIIVGD